MKIMKWGLFFVLSLIFGDFIILYAFHVLQWPVYINYVLGALWGYVVGTYTAKGVDNECR